MIQFFCIAGYFCKVFTAQIVEIVAQIHRIQLGKEIRFIEKVTYPLFKGFEPGQKVHKTIEVGFLRYGIFQKLKGNIAFVPEKGCKTGSCLIIGPIDGIRCFFKELET